jgi:hypothetical protein
MSASPKKPQNDSPPKNHSDKFTSSLSWSSAKVAFSQDLKPVRRCDRGHMSQNLVANGCAVTVDAARNIPAAGFVVIDGARISAVGPSERPPKTLAHVKFARSL